METILNQLQTLSQKSKLNKTDAVNISDMLMQIYEKNNDITTICDWLMQFQLEATNMFFAENYSKIYANNELDNIINTLMSLDSFKKNTRDCSVNRAVVIINICLEKENYSAIVEVLFTKMLEFVINKNRIKSSFITSFNKKIINNTDYNFLKLNFKDESKSYLFLLIRHLNLEGHLDINSPEFINSNYSKEYLSKKDELIETINSTPSATKTPAKNTRKSVDTDELAESIKNLQLITEKISQSLNEDYGTISNLKEKVSKQDQIIEKNTNDLLLEQEKSNELSLKLKQSFQMDESTANQNLITLKTDISNGLKFEYDTFYENIDCECDEDNFEAYKSTIIRIFRTLKRLGITFE